MKVILFLEVHNDPSTINFIGDHLQEFKNMGCRIFHQELNSDPVDYRNHHESYLKGLEVILGKDYIDKIADELRSSSMLKSSNALYEEIINEIKNCDEPPTIIEMKLNGFVELFQDKELLYVLLERSKTIYADIEVTRYAEGLGMVVNPVDYSGGIEIPEHYKKIRNVQLEEMKVKLEQENNLRLEEVKQELYQGLRNRGLSVDPKGGLVINMVEKWEQLFENILIQNLKREESLYDRNYYMVKNIIDQSKYDPLTIARNGVAHGKSMKQLLEEFGYDVLIVHTYDNSLYQESSVRVNRNNAYKEKFDGLKNALSVDVNDKKSYDGLMDKINAFVEKEIKPMKQFDKVDSIESASQQRRDI